VFHVIFNAYFAWYVITRKKESLIMLKVDQSGSSLLNKIQNEIHQLKPLVYPQRQVIQPKKSPFFSDGFILNHINNDGVESSLTKDIHFVFSAIDNTASIVTGKQVCHELIILDSNLTGSLKIISYQCYGDIDSPNVQEVKTQARELMSGSKTIDVFYDSILDKPQSVNPKEHDAVIDDFVGFSNIKQTIDGSNITAKTDIILDMPLIGSKKLLTGDVCIQNRPVVLSNSETGVVTKDSNDNLNVTSVGSLGKATWQKDKNTGHISVSKTKQSVDEKNAAAAEIVNLSSTSSYKVGTVVTTMDSTLSNILATDPKWIKLTSSKQKLLRSNYPTLSTNLPSPDSLVKITDVYENFTTSSTVGSTSVYVMSDVTGTIIYPSFGTSAGSILIRKANLDSVNITGSTRAWPLTSTSSNEYNMACVKGVFFVYDKWKVAVSKDDGVNWTVFNTSIPLTVSPSFGNYGYMNNVMLYDSQNDKCYFIMDTSYYSPPEANMLNKVFVGEYILSSNTFNNYTYSNAAHKYSDYKGSYVYKGKLILPYLPSGTTSGSTFKLRYKAAPFNADSFTDCIFPSDYANTEFPWLYSSLFFEFDNKLFIVVTKRASDGISRYTLLESTDGITYTRSSFTFSNTTGGDMGTNNYYVDTYSDSKYKIIYFYLLGNANNNLDYMFISVNNGTYKKVNITIPVLSGSNNNVQTISVDPITEKIFLTRGDNIQNGYQALYSSSDLGDNWTKISGIFLQDLDPTKILFYKGYILSSRYLIGGQGGNPFLYDLDFNIQMYPSGTNYYDSSGTIIVKSSPPCKIDKNNVYGTNVSLSITRLGDPKRAVSITKNSNYIFFVRDKAKTFTRYQLTNPNTTEFLLPTKFTPATGTDTYSPTQYIRALP
jgi:hypothetical protein